MTDAADRIVDLYQRRARDWDRARGRGLLEKAWLERFSALVPPGGSVLDVGCGAGEPIAAYLIQQGFAVTGVDSARAMLEMAASRFPRGRWITGDMRALSLGERFDGLLAWDSFFHLRHDDQRGMFPIFAEHAKPGAALMFTSGPGFGEAIGSFGGEPLYHASLDADEYRALLNASGFAVEAHAVEDAQCGGHTIWLARRRTP